VGNASYSNRKDLRLKKIDPTSVCTDILKSLQSFPINLQKVYPKSFRSLNGLTYGLIRTLEGKKLIVMGEVSRIADDPFKGETYHQSSTLKVCDLSIENTQTLMTLFPYTKPTSLKKRPITIGVGDRLGLATPGHIRAIQRFQVGPVLAQQSVRENAQTGRTFTQVIQDAAWAVFQENYQSGYGADGDHLKSLREVENALDAGVSMVTLDLSEKLNLEAFRDPIEVIDRKFIEEIDEGDAEVLFHLFLNKDFSFRIPNGGFSIQFDKEILKRNVLFLHKAIDFTQEVYEFIHSRPGDHGSIDFEISIDETPFPTSPENHLFFIIELNYRGISIDSLAPRFIGEFQKGVDYRGDLAEFREQFYQHAMIARDFGNYKISIHSGSDKFSVFPDMGEIAKAGIHLKTAGTSWLEAMRLIALTKPSLYIEMHQFALSVFEEASKLYHVTTDLNRIPKIETLTDQELPSFLDQEDSRQLLHITYGYLLNAKGENGGQLFRDRFFQTLAQYEEEYWSLLETHIEKHLNSLGVEKVKLPVQ
jgi:tagaturonate epimerase